MAYLVQNREIKLCSTTLEIRNRCRVCILDKDQQWADRRPSNLNKMVYAIKLTFQSTGVATLALSVSCKESTTRKISLKIKNKVQFLKNKKQVKVKLKLPVSSNLNNF